MKAKACLMAIIFTIIVTKAGARKGSRNADNKNEEPKYIEPMSYAFFRSKAPQDVREKCNFDLLNAYSLYGDAPSIGYKNELCPKLSENCCGPKDMQKIPELWRYDQKRMQAHNVAYLRLMKYLIGFGKEYKKLADKIVRNSDRENGKAWGRDVNKDKQENKEEILADITDECLEAAREVSRINYDSKPKAQAFYDRLNERARFLQTFRYNFYCMMCSPLGHSSISMPGWALKNIFFQNNRIYFSKDLCETFAGNTIGVTYELFRNYNYYMQKVIRLTKCINLKENKYDVAGIEFQDLVEDPLGFESTKKTGRISDCRQGAKGKFSFRDCRKFCNAFNIAAPSTFFDGDLSRLIHVFYYAEQLEPLMKYPSTNVFNDDMARLKTSIHEYLSKRDERFFKSISRKIDFARFKTRFDSKSYIDPMEMGDNNALYFQYLSTTLLSAITSALLLKLL